MYNYLSNGSKFDFENTDGYKYGTDPLALRDAFVEQGGSISVDEETGVESYDVVYADLEMLQDGVHSNGGLTCVSCHMPEVERDGTTFRSHNASGSPLQSEEALQLCLTCHTTVDSTDAMVEFVRNKQAEIRVLDEELVEKMDKLATLIAEADAGEALDTAKANYLDASTYRNFCKTYACTDTEIKVAHNPGKFDEYMNKSIELVDEGIAALS